MQTTDGLGCSRTWGHLYHDGMSEVQKCVCLSRRIIQELSDSPYHHNQMIHRRETNTETTAEASSSVGRLDCLRCVVTDGQAGKET